MQRPRRISQMRPSDSAQIRTSRSDDAVDVIGLKHRADGNRTDTNFITNTVSERRLIHAAVDRFGVARGLARRHVDEVCPGLLEQSCDHNCVISRIPARCPIVRGNPNAHRQIFRPCSAYGAKYFKWIAATIFDIAAVFVGTFIGQRTDERREQIAMRAVQFEPIESGMRRALSR